MPYIVSKLSASTDYVQYQNTGGPGASIPAKRVTIKGGADVADRKHALAEGILTPNGCITKVTDDELEFLKANAVFQTHLNNGHVTILDSRENPNKVAQDMDKDVSAPLTPSDYEEGGREFKAGVQAPTTGSVTEESED